jgi:hypothetical protein
MSGAERTWGGASKVYTTRYETYKRITDSENPHKFSRLIDAFHAAAAVGIRLRAVPDTGGTEKREELVNVYSIDPDGVLWAVMSAIHPEASGAERFEKLMIYADQGIERLEEGFTIYGNLQMALDALLG